MPNINIISNGVLKSIDFSPWGGIDGFLEASVSGANSNRLRKLVSWLNKAVNMTANAVAQLPYSIYDKAYNIVELETAWGGVKNPQTLLSLVSASLCSGQAYCLVDTTGRAIVDIQYLMPQTMKCNFDSNGEPASFTRTMQTGTKVYQPEQVLYFWLPDDTVETGPAAITPMINATLPAGLIAAMDDSLRQYGERGFIPPMILAASGMTNKSDVEKTERWWNAFLRGWTRTVAKIINAEKMTPTVVGAGMDELRGTYIQITRQQIENIASSFNIPLSLFLSNAANYATANADRKTWYETGVFVNIYQTVEDTLSTQLFSRFGWDMEFEPEGLDAFQEDENAKAGSLSALASAFAANPEAALIAAEVLGYDLTEKQIAAINALNSTDVGSNVSTSPLPSDQDNRIADELMTWREFAFKNVKHPFKTKDIPPAFAVRVQAELGKAKTRDEIQAVFDNAYNEMPIVLLAKAIEGMK